MTVPLALAQEAAFQGRTYHLPDALVVGENDTLVIGPGATLTGPGSLEVWGRLEVLGAPDDPAEVGVPVRLHGPGPHLVRHARLWGVDGPAIALANATLRVEDAVFQASVIGLLVGGNASAEGARVVFQGHSEDGLRVAEGGRASLRDVRLEGNTAGARLQGGGTLRLEGVRASGNAVHVAADVSPSEDGAPRLLLVDADLGSVSPGGVAGLRVQGAGEDAGPHPGVLVTGGRIHDAPIGLSASGPALRIRVENVSIDRNAVGVSVVHASIELKDVRLGNARDVDDSSSQVLLDNVTRMDATAAARAPPGGPSLLPAVLFWGGLAAALVVGGAAWAVGQRRRRRPRPAPPAPPREEQAPPPAEETPAPPSAAPAAPMGAQERRVLQDILAHPDTAQSAVAERLGLTRQAVHYHVKKLEAKGLIVKSQVGRESRCRAAPGAEAALGGA